jgi:hypothetical protein
MPPIREADDDVVDLAGPPVPQGRGHARPQAGRAHVGVEVQGEAELPAQEAGLAPVRRAHPGETRRPLQHGVGPPAGLQDRGRKGVAGALVQAGAHLVFLEGEGQPERLAGGVEHLHPLGHHLGADAVTPQHCDLIPAFRHGEPKD